MNKTKNNELLSCYLTVGEDKLKRSQARRRLEKLLQTDGVCGFNYDKFDGLVASGSAVVEAANTLPFGNDKRLVVLENPEALKKDDSELIVEYLSNPNPNTVILFDSEKLAKNTRLYKAISKHGKQSIISCKQKKSYELIEVVKELANQEGCAFSAAAARTLIELTGSDTTELESSVKRIALAYQHKKTVTENDVRSVVQKTSSFQVWDFCDSLAQRNKKVLLEYLKNMEDISPYQLLPACVNRLRELLCAKNLIETNKKSQLASELSVFRGRKILEWQVKNHFIWAQLWTENQLIKAITHATKTEFAMKSGSNPEDAFVDWVLLNVLDISH